MFDSIRGILGVSVVGIILVLHKCSEFHKVEKTGKRKTTVVSNVIMMQVAVFSRDLRLKQESCFNRCQELG